MGVKSAVAAENVKFMNISRSDLIINKEYL